MKMKAMPNRSRNSSEPDQRQRGFDSNANTDVTAGTIVIIPSASPIQK